MESNRDPLKDETSSMASIIFEIISKRRSIRKFKQKSVSEEICLKLLEAARLAPSASNRQPGRFYLVKKTEMEKKLRPSGAVLQKFIYNAPLCIVCCADMSVYSDKETNAAIKELIESDKNLVIDSEDAESYFAWWNRVSKDVLKLAFLDVGIAVTQMMFMAEALNLGTCWMRRINEDDLGKALNLPKNLVVVSLLAVGYPDEKPRPRPRKELNHFYLNPPLPIDLP